MSSLRPVPPRPPGRSPFDAIRHVDENSDGTEFEYWSAREAMGPLGYTRWENMENVIRKAKSSCRNASYEVADHFRDVTKMIGTGKGAERPVTDVQMSRLGMYLLAMCGDPDKSEIAAAQRYFVIQTRRAEVLLPPAPASTQSPAPEPVLRPWAERFRRTFMPHVCDLRLKHPGCFSVVSAVVTEIVFIEDELVRHLITTRGFDRPDISIGGRWSRYRAEDLLLPQTIRSADLFLPDQQLTVEVKVYEGSEWATFQTWFCETYLTEHLGYYLDHKKELKPYRREVRFSAADNTSRALGGRPAVVPAPIRAALTASRGFIPHRPALPPG